MDENKCEFSSGCSVVVENNLRGELEFLQISRKINTPKNKINDMDDILVTEHELKSYSNKQKFHAKIMLNSVCEIYENFIPFNDNLAHF